MSKHNRAPTAAYTQTNPQLITPDTRLLDAQTLIHILHLAESWVGAAVEEATADPTAFSHCPHHLKDMTEMSKSTFRNYVESLRLGSYLG